MRSALVCSVAVLLCTGCSKPEAKKSVEESKVVATVGSRSITVEEVEAEFAAQPDFVRARYSTPERKQEFVDSLVRTELLVQEARRLELDKRPEVRALFEKVLVQSLMTEVSKAAVPTESEIKAWYDAHQNEFSKPERVRVAVVEFGGTANTSPATKAAVEKELERLRSSKENERARAFNALVASRSTHESSRLQEGDVGPRTHDELAQQFSAQVADAAFALKTPGQLSGAAEGPRGFVLLRLLGRQPAEVRPFEGEKAQLTARLTAEARTRQVEQLELKLRERVKPVVAVDVVARLRTNP